MTKSNYCAEVSRCIRGQRRVALQRCSEGQLHVSVVHYQIDAGQLHIDVARYKINAGHHASVWRTTKMMRRNYA